MHISRVMPPCKEGLQALQKWAIFWTYYTLHGNTFCSNILTLYIFERLMTLTLERIQTNFDPNILVTVAVH